MNSKAQDLEKVAFGIAGMFGIYWIYSCFLEQHLPLSDGCRTILGVIILYVVGLGLFRLSTKNVPDRKYKKKKVSFKTVLICFLLQFTAIMIFIVIVNISTALRVNDITTEINATSLHMLFMLLIFNPIAEELVFRKLFADKLLQYGEGFYMLVSSFCFGIVHGVSLGVPQIIYTFILGMIWSYLMVKTGDIKIVVIMHAMSNLFGSVMTQALLSFSMTAAGVYSMILMLLGVAGLVSFFVNKKKVMVDDEPGLLKKTALKDMLCNRGILFYIVLTLIVVLCDRI